MKPYYLKIKRWNNYYTRTLFRLTDMNKSYKTNLPSLEREKIILDTEESNGKIWTTRSLSLFDSDDNVIMIIRTLDLIKNKWSRYGLLQKHFSIIAKRKKKLKIIVRRNSWGEKWRKEIKETQTSQVKKTNTKVQREKKWTVSETLTNEFGTWSLERRWICQSENLTEEEVAASSDFETGRTKLSRASPTPLHKLL